MIIYYLIHYILFIISLLSIPYIVFRYILAGDEYLIVSNKLYPYLWIISLLFLIGYLFSYLENIFRCFYQSTDKNKWNISNIIKKINTITISSVYNGIYVTIFGLTGYVIGSNILDNVPQIRDLFMSVVHIPGFEYTLKGFPLMIGAIISRLLTSICITNTC